MKKINDWLKYSLLGRITNNILFGLSSIILGIIMAQSFGIIVCLIFLFVELAVMGLVIDTLLTEHEELKKQAYSGGDKIDLS